MQLSASDSSHELVHQARESQYVDRLLRASELDSGMFLIPNFSMLVYNTYALSLDPGPASALMLKVGHLRDHLLRPMTSASPFPSRTALWSQAPASSSLVSGLLWNQWYTSPQGSFASVAIRLCRRGQRQTTTLWSRLLQMMCVLPNLCWIGDGNPQRFSFPLILI